MNKDFLRNEKEIREESRETLDYLNEEKEEELGLIQRELNKIRKMSTGIL